MRERCVRGCVRGVCNCGVIEGCEREVFLFSEIKKNNKITYPWVWCSGPQGLSRTLCSYNLSHQTCQGNPGT